MQRGEEKALGTPWSSPSSYLTRGCLENVRDTQFIKAGRDKTRSNSSNLQRATGRWAIGKTLLMLLRVVGRWERLPRD